MEAIKMIPTIVLALVVAGIVTAAGLKTLSSFKSSVNTGDTNDTAEYNATGQVIDGIEEVSNQFSTIGIIAAMVIILMLIGGLTAYFGLR